MALLSWSWSCQGLITFAYVHHQGNICKLILDVKAGQGYVLASERACTAGMQSQWPCDVQPVAISNAHCFARMPALVLQASLYHTVPKGSHVQVAIRLRLCTRSLQHWVIFAVGESGCMQGFCTARSGAHCARRQHVPLREAKRTLSAAPLATSSKLLQLQGPG